MCLQRALLKQVIVFLTFVNIWHIKIIMEQSKIYSEILLRDKIPPEEWEKIQQLFPEKNESFYMSRICLWHLCQRFEPLPINVIQLENHQFIQALDHLRFSISHTKDFSIAIATDKNNAQGIGVDCEAQTRNMKEGAEKYFSHEKDRHALSLLEVWSIKEAAFKAFANAGYPIKLIKEVYLQPPHVYYDSHLGTFEKVEHPQFFIHHVVVA